MEGDRGGSPPTVCENTIACVSVLRPCYVVSSSRASDLTLVFLSSKEALSTLERDAETFHSCDSGLDDLESSSLD